MSRVINYLKSIFDPQFAPYNPNVEIFDNEGVCRCHLKDGVVTITLKSGKKQTFGAQS